jgi:hypothetical protein
MWVVAVDVDRSALNGHVGGVVGDVDVNGQFLNYLFDVIARLTTTRFPGLWLVMRSNLTNEVVIFAGGGCIWRQTFPMIMTSTVHVRRKKRP